MKQIPIGFPHTLEIKLRQNAKNKDIKVAQYVRELVDIGLRVEETATNNQGNNKKTNPAEILAELKELWENNLTWALEIRYLTRYLVENHPEGTKEKHLAILSMAREKAKVFVEELLCKETFNLG